MCELIVGKTSMYYMLWEEQRVVEYIDFLSSNNPKMFPHTKLNFNANHGYVEI